MTSEKSKILIDKKDIPLFYHLCRNGFNQEVDEELIEVKSNYVENKIGNFECIVLGVLAVIGVILGFPEYMVHLMCFCLLLLGLTASICITFKPFNHYYRSKFNKNNDLNLLFPNHYNDNLIDITNYYKKLESSLSQKYVLNSNIDFYLPHLKKIQFNDIYILTEEVLNKIIFNIDLLNKYSQFGFSDNDEIIASIIKTGYQKHGASYLYEIKGNPLIDNQYFTLCKHMEYLFNFSMPNGVIYNNAFIVNYQIMLDINRYLEQSILFKEKNPSLTWNLSNECLTQLKIESFISTNKRTEILEFLLQEIKYIFEQNKMEVMGEINQITINNDNVNVVNNDSTVSTKNDIYCYNKI